MSARPVQVLVVDDSAVVRQTLLALLTEAGGFQVSVAADPLVAIHYMASARPDVIVLDLSMPRMDGLTFLRRVMAEDPIPVVVCSSFAAHTGHAAIDALEAGAVDVITKPVLGVRGFLEEQLVAIVDTLQAAARVRLPRAQRAAAATGPLEAARALEPHAGSVAGAAPSQRSASSRIAGARTPIVAIGASTGGTRALRSILRALPAEAPAFVVVQHMPAGFTRAFAERLDQETALEVREASDGDGVQPGRVLIAPGDCHLRLRAGGERVEVGAGPFVSRHRPSVDVLFHSVAETSPARALGVLLTGMGDDGAEGLLAMRRAGAFTVAQDESTSAVFGMPKEAIRRGAAARVLPLPLIPEAIRAFASGPAGERASRHGTSGAGEVPR